MDSKKKKKKWIFFFIFGFEKNCDSFVIEPSFFRFEMIQAFLLQRLLVGDLPLNLVAYLSWTCKTFRQSAIQYAKKSVIDISRVQVFGGRWMLRHNAKIADIETACAITHHEMISSLPAKNSAIKLTWPVVKPSGPPSSHFLMFIFANAGDCTRFDRFGVPKVSMFEDFLHQERSLKKDRIEWHLNHGMHWFENYAWPIEHLVLFAKATWNSRLSKLGIQQLMLRGHSAVARSIALELGGEAFESAIELFDNAETTVEELIPVSKTNIERIFDPRKDRKHLSNEFVHTLLGTEYNKDCMARFLSKRNGKAFRYALEKGFLPDDEFLSRIISFSTGKVFLEFLKKRIGLCRFIECLKLPLDSQITAKHVTFSDCANEQLSPKAAFKLIQMNPDAEIDDENTRKLLTIALGKDDKKKKRIKKQVDGESKRRKIV